MTHHNHDTLERGAGTGNVVTAMFDDHATASRAVDELVHAGFPRDCVNLARDDQAQSRTGYGDGTSYGSGASSDTAYGERTGDGGGFWATVSDYFSSDDRSVYEEGMRRGGYLVSAEVADGEEDRAATILRNCGAIDIDERAASWRASGWQGYGSGLADAGDGSVLTRDNSEAAGSDFGRDRPAGDETVVPIAQEKLNVGKRVLEGGRVRVHTRVAETPVEEQVTLREEHVDVKRRPASGTMSGAGGDPFQERTIEVETTREVPVVSKEAHVTEEVVVDKTAAERTETVRDTVRHTEVDVDDSEKATRPGDRSGRRDKGKTVG